MPAAAQPLIVADEVHLTDKDFVTNPDWFLEDSFIDGDGVTRKILPTPNYTVQETAKFFFGKSSDWLRWRSKKTPDNPDGLFIINGEPLPDRRTDVGFRYYTLADIERMGHAMAHGNGIDGATLNNLIGLIKYSCRQYGYL